MRKESGNYVFLYGKGTHIAYNEHLYKSDESRNDHQILLMLIHDLNLHPGAFGSILGWWVQVIPSIFVTLCHIILQSHIIF